MSKKLKKKMKEFESMLASQQVTIDKLINQIKQPEAKKLFIDGKDSKDLEFRFIKDGTNSIGIDCHECGSENELCTCIDGKVYCQECYGKEKSVDCCQCDCETIHGTFHDDKFYCRDCMDKAEIKQQPKRKVNCEPSQECKDCLIREQCKFYKEQAEKESIKVGTAFAKIYPTLELRIAVDKMPNSFGVLRDEAMEHLLEIISRPLVECDRYKSKNSGLWFTDVTEEIKQDCEVCFYKKFWLNSEVSNRIECKSCCAYRPPDECEAGYLNSDGNCKHFRKG
jgi:hypothetical protein